jgi:hypothetical protein
MCCGRSSMKACAKHAAEHEWRSETTAAGRRRLAGILSVASGCSLRHSRLCSVWLMPEPARPAKMRRHRSEHVIVNSAEAPRAQPTHATTTKGASRRAESMTCYFVADT